MSISWRAARTKKKRARPRTAFKIFEGNKKCRAGDAVEHMLPALTLLVGVIPLKLNEQCPLD